MWKYLIILSNPAGIKDEQCRPISQLVLWGCGGGERSCKISVFMLHLPWWKQTTPASDGHVDTILLVWGQSNSDVSLPWQLTAVISTGPSVIEACCKQCEQCKGLFKVNLYYSETDVVSDGFIDNPI